MKKILVLVVGILLIGINLYAADGDLIVEENVGIGSNLTNPGARLEINTDITANKGLIIKGAASQSANLQEWQDSSGNVLASVGNTGNFGIGVNPLASYNFNITSTKRFPFNITHNYSGANPISGINYQLNLTSVGNIDSPLTGFNIRQVLQNQGDFLVNSGITPFNLQIWFNAQGAGLTNTVNSGDGVSAINAVFDVPSTNQRNWTFTLPVSQATFAGFFNTNGAGGTFTFSDFRNIFIGSGSGPVTMTNQTGLFIENMTRSASNNINLAIGVSTPPASGNYSIYNNSNYNNYFAGALGIGTTTPNTKADINGDIALRAGTFTAVNGNNNNINIGGTSFIRITGPTLAFTITGIAGGVDGKVVILYNATTTQNMTISNDNTNSQAANRIYVLNGTSISTTGAGAITLIYDAASSRWIVTAVQP